MKSVGAVMAASHCYSCQFWVVLQLRQGNLQSVVVEICSAISQIYMLSMNFPLSCLRFDFVSYMNHLDLGLMNAPEFTVCRLTNVAEIVLLHCTEKGNARFVLRVRLGVAGATVSRMGESTAKSETILRCQV